jgi:LmbE family N-acetylglucosaminyl deacetylase
VAHPDDEILGCGGSIIKFSKNCTIKTIFTCKTHDYRNNIKHSDNNKKRQIAAQKVAEYLKIKNPLFLNYPGLKMNRSDITKMAKSIYDEILKFKPDSIFSHCIDDNHHDHRVTAEAVLIATRPSPKTVFIKKILSMEIPSASEKLFSKKKSFKPNYFIDVETTYKKKLELLSKFYTKELLPYPNSRSLRSIKTLTEYRGNLVNLKFAEAFELIRIIQ